MLIAATVFTINTEAHDLKLTLDIGAYWNMNLNEQEYEWEDGGSPVAVFRLRLGNQRVGCEYMHVSNYLTGAPFNDRTESTLDALGCAVRVDIWGG